MAEIVYRFTGGHEPDGKPSQWHEGIPARHLKQEDVDRLQPDKRDLLEISPIYTKAENVPPKPKRPAAKAKKPAAHPTSATEQVTDQPQPDGSPVGDEPPSVEGEEP